MRKQEGSKQVEIFLTRKTPIHPEKIDSEVEWYRGMKSHGRRNIIKSKKLSIDTQSLMKPYYLYEIDNNDAFNANYDINQRHKRFGKFFNSSKRVFDEEIKLPSHFSFGFNLHQDLGLDKRESLDLTENHCEAFKNSKFVKRDTVIYYNVSDGEKKKSNAETKHYSSICNQSSDQISVTSNGSGCSKLKLGNKIFFKNIEEKSFHRYQNLHSLHKLLKKHFKGQDLDDEDVQLNSNELFILKSIITRKYKNKVNFNTKNPFLKDRLIRIGTLDSNKRLEENYKFIFKRCLKFMKSEFKMINMRRNKKDQIEKAFYSYYFKDIADKEHLKLENFYHPKNSQSKVKNLPKTINGDYIENICKNPTFVQKFLNYANTQLKIDYEKVIDVKIEALIRKWDDMFYSNKPTEVIIKEIQAYIEKNKKCKLPWNFSEIDEALIVTCKLFKGYIKY